MKMMFGMTKEESLIEAITRRILGKAWKNHFYKKGFPGKSIHF